MKEKFEEIITIIKPEIERFGFIPKGKDSFIKKSNDKEDKIVLEYRRGKGKEFENSIYVSAMANITFPQLNKEDKKIIKDFLNTYPVIGGSIQHFYEENSKFLSIEVNENTNLKEVAKEIVFYIENGAFKLFEKYKSLKDIIISVENKDENFNKFHKFLDFRSAIRFAAMKYLIEGKEIAISWFETLEIPTGNLNKEEILEKMKINWS